jgi:hypothetical protein
MIVERQADAEHGSAIAERLSSDLRAEFPGINGFSRRNVFYMREFYLLYRDDERVQPLVAQSTRDLWLFLAVCHFRLCRVRRKDGRTFALVPETRYLLHLKCPPSRHAS